MTCTAVQTTRVGVTGLRGMAGGQTLSGTVRIEAVAEGSAVTMGHRHVFRGDYAHRHGGGHRSQTAAFSASLRVSDLRRQPLG